MSAMVASPDQNLHVHVPSITKNQISVSQFTKSNKVLFQFHPTFCYVKNQETC